MSDIRRREVMNVDDWVVRKQMPEFQKAMTPHLDFTRRVGASAPHQYYASDVTQNAFAGWLAARRDMVCVGAVSSKGAWPKAELNAAGRELKDGAEIFALLPWGGRR